MLVIDVGGTHVKFEHSGSAERRVFESGPKMTAEQMVEKVMDATKDWTYQVIAVGIPAPVMHDRVQHEPHNLGSGWVGFDFAEAFGNPTKLINDAAMQALGSYHGGKMLFLGLGTGLGSTMIDDGRIEPMELGHLPYKHKKTFEDYVGMRGLEHRGKAKWQKAVHDVVERLREALEVDYVIIGGGNARLLDHLPPQTEICQNDIAFSGGYRLWDHSDQSNCAK